MTAITHVISSATDRDPPRPCKSLAAAAHEIEDADLLLFRRQPRSLISRAIAQSGRSEYSHAAKVAWWRGLPMCVEVRGHYGARAVTLASQVTKYPGLIDVYRPNADGARHYLPFKAASYMVAMTGHPYGFRAILRASLAYLVGVRWFHKTDTNDGQLDSLPVFCSEAVSRADRLGGGVDPVPHLADRETEPGDLARSAFYQFQFSLVP